MSEQVIPIRLSVLLYYLHDQAASEARRVRADAADRGISEATYEQGEADGKASAFGLLASLLFPLPHQGAEGESR